MLQGTYITPFNSPSNSTMEISINVTEDEPKPVVPTIFWDYDITQVNIPAPSLIPPKPKEMTLTLKDINKADYQPLSKIFSLIYRVLKSFLIGSDHHNQAHLVSKFDTLSSHLDLNVGAADALMQLIEGNSVIVQGKMLIFFSY